MLHHYVHKERPLISTLLLAIWVVFSLSSMLYAASQVTTISLTILDPNTNTGTTNTGVTNNWGGIGWGEEREWCDGDNDEDDIWCDEDTDDTIDDSINENTDTNNIDGNINTNPETTNETHGSAEEQPKDAPILIKKPTIPEIIVEEKEPIIPVNKNEELANYWCVVWAPSINTVPLLQNPQNPIQLFKTQLIEKTELLLLSISHIHIDDVKLIVKELKPKIKKYNSLLFKTILSIPMQRFIETMTFPITNVAPNFAILYLFKNQVTSAFDITRFN
jgi:hypothetical protein